MIKSYEREVILALFQANDWFDLYELHEQKLLSPAQIVAALMMLTSNNLCDVEGTKAKLTESGIRWVLKNRRRLFMKSDRSWAMPYFDAERTIKVGQPYMPRLKSVDIDFFRRLD